MREKVLKLLNSYRETHFTNIECDTCICNDEDFIGLVNYVENMTPWHSVADSDWPKLLKGDAEDMPFVVISKGGHQFFAYYDADEDGICDFYDDCDCPLDVEYWMEIPKLPEK